MKNKLLYLLISISVLVPVSHCVYFNSTLDNYFYYFQEYKTESIEENQCRTVVLDSNNRYYSLVNNCPKFHSCYFDNAQDEPIGYCEETKHLLPGDTCQKDKHCRDGALKCIDGVCVGFKVGEKCTSYLECDVGLFCDETQKICTPQKEENAACQNDYECINTHGCNIGKCTKYVSVSLYDRAEKDIFCSSGTNYNDKYQGFHICIDNEIFPFESDSEDLKFACDYFNCRYTAKNKQGQEFEYYKNGSCRLTHSYDNNFCDKDTANYKTYPSIVQKAIDPKAHTLNRFSMKKLSYEEIRIFNAPYYNANTDKEIGIIFELTSQSSRLLMGVAFLLAILIL